MGQAVVRSALIDGVRTKSIDDIVDARGMIQHMVRADEPDLFPGFGEIYFSFTNPGVLKAWHRQAVQINVLSCILGRLRLVLYDDRPDSPTHRAVQVIDFGDGARQVVRVPAGVIYGWRNMTDLPAILANCASHPHDPRQSEKIDPASGRVPYVW